MKSELLKEIVDQYPELILEPFDELVPIVGFDCVYTLSEFYGGSQIYIPTNKRLFSRCVCEQIRKEYDGTNLLQLAKKYGLCTRTVRNYLFG